MKDAQALLELASDAVRRAGELVGRRPVELSVETKSTPTDVVTAMDGAAERLIVDALLGARPDDGVLGEEGAGRPGTSGVRWIIDPIDGTVNYLYGLPGYAVSVAAEVDGQVAAGAVLNVLGGELYTATAGGGAACNGTPIRCSERSELAQSLIGTGFAYDAATRAAQAQVLTGVLPKVRDIRRFGSCAIDICYVAAGRLDGYYEWGPFLWDYAAAGLIATEAGARIMAEAGRLVVAGAPGIFDALRAIVPATLPD